VAGAGILAWRGATPRRLVAGAAALVVMFVLVNPIFSLQFFCWMAPFVAVAGAGAGCLGRGVLALGLLVDALTYLQFPWFIFDASGASEGCPYSLAFDVVIYL